MWRLTASALNNGYRQPRTGDSQPHNWATKLNSAGDIWIRGLVPGILTVHIACVLGVLTQVTKYNL
jgi:hypothetical protein